MLMVGDVLSMSDDKCRKITRRQPTNGVIKGRPYLRPPKKSIDVPREAKRAYEIRKAMRVVPEYKISPSYKKKENRRVVNAIQNVDCMEGIKKLPSNSVDIVVTDPPYFLPVNSYVGVRGQGYDRRTLADTSIMKTYFKTLFEELSRVIKPDGTFYVFCDAQSYPIFYEAMFPFCKYVRIIVWDKMISYNGYTWRHQHEIIAWGELDASKRIPTGDGDIIKCRGVLQKDRLHPAEKPVVLMKKLISKHNLPTGSLILDPFAGSAPVWQACKELHLDFIGFELNEEYCKIAEERLRKVPRRLDKFD